MRKIVAALFMSLDGVVEGPGPTDAFEKAGWTMPYYVPEIGEYIGQSSAESDGMLLGRITYQGFQQAFEPQGNSDPFAAMMNGATKYVVSNSLTSADWMNSRLIGGNVIQEITSLKQQDGRNLNISGSITLVQSLLPHGLIDQLDLLVHPVTVGMGQRLFVDGFGAGFRLLESRSFSSGVVLLSLAPNAT